MPGYSPKYPLTFQAEDGYFAMNKTIFDAIRQNMKNLVLTNPGERIMDPVYGVGISKYLFENVKDSVSVSLTSELQYQVRRYLPQVNLLDIEILSSRDRDDISDNGLYVRIRYVIPSFGITDEITIGPNELALD